MHCGTAPTHPRKLLIARTAELGADVGEPDVEAVLHELSAARARAARDLSALEQEAAAHEAFGAAEGIPSISAEAADSPMYGAHGCSMDDRTPPSSGDGVP